MTDPAVEDTAGIDRDAYRVGREATRGPAPMSHLWGTTGLRMTVILFLCIGLACIGLLPGGVAAVAPPLRLSRPSRGALVLLGALLVLGAASMRHLTLTADEPQHLQYGQQILRLDATRLDDSKMPVSALNAVPGAVAARLSPGPVRSFLKQDQTGRYATLLASLLVAACVFAWARDLYGDRAGLLALTLYAFDPNLLAHSQLITTDVYAAGAIAFALTHSGASSRWAAGGGRC